MRRGAPSSQPKPVGLGHRKVLLSPTSKFAGTVGPDEQGKEDVHVKSSWSKRPRIERSHCFPPASPSLHPASCPFLPPQSLLSPPSSVPPALPLPSHLRPHPATLLPLTSFLCPPPRAPGFAILRRTSLPFCRLREWHLPTWHFAVFACGTHLVRARLSLSVPARHRA